MHACALRGMCCIHYLRHTGSCCSQRVKESLISLGMNSEGKQNLLPQNMPLGDIDYFKLIIFKKQKAQKEPLNFPFYIKGIQIKKSLVKGKEVSS